ncbi:LacI family DNA-binding transcriptional regulator [Microbacterium sp. VKM Ac-2923]|uniref:LacI family DNA-binding transcriptional regulator n=1 Tax=Microbacterium sp. VKM Ac-2923 TaxID=2929476 RepID=UPI001FB396A7|nr:LacI family DNA-binding transcriptional regulator [Microbacterium sp. VKM Ac-2923]MCJ1709477.1 LacI family DNA-binding transcriptional regulator [Microbacterium sp. VKM Ac-2923]
MNAAAQPAPRGVPPHSPTIADVARLAGVAKTTVSYTLNDSGFVSAERRARILAAVEELGYRPNTHARALRLRRAGRIGVVCADLAEGSAARIINGIRAAARPHRLTVVLLEEEPPGDTTPTPVPGPDVDGVIVCEPRRGRENASSTMLPTVDVALWEVGDSTSPESVGGAAVDQLVETMDATMPRIPSPPPGQRRHNGAAKNPRPPRT